MVMESSFLSLRFRLSVPPPREEKLLPSCLILLPPCRSRSRCENDGKDIKSRATNARYVNFSFSVMVLGLCPLSLELQRVKCKLIGQVENPVSKLLNGAYQFLK